MKPSHTAADATRDELRARRDRRLSTTAVAAEGRAERETLGSFVEVIERRRVSAESLVCHPCKSSSVVCISVVSCTSMYVLTSWRLFVRYRTRKRTIIYHGTRTSTVQYRSEVRKYSAATLKQIDFLKA